MSKHPVAVRKPSELRAPDDDVVDAVEPFGKSVWPFGFVRFGYSITEITAQGGQANVRSRSTRFEDGKLTTETFEGTLDRSAYDNMVGQAWNQVAGLASTWLQALSLFLPPGRRPPDGRD